MRHSGFIHGLGMLILLASVLAAGACAVMLLWNALIPAVTGFLTVNYWQAFGLLILGLTLSGGILFPLMGIAHIFHPAHSRRHRELREKWLNMSEEERKAFIESRGFRMHGRD